MSDINKFCETCDCKPCQCSKLVIHEKCGLDIELCDCPDSKFYWDSENDCIRERTPPIKDKERKVK